MIPKWFPPGLFLTLCSLAVGVGLITICMELGVLQSKALLAGLLAFMTMRIVTGYLLAKVSREK